MLKNKLTVKLIKELYIKSKTECERLEVANDKREDVTGLVFSEIYYKGRRDAYLDILQRIGNRFE